MVNQLDNDKADFDNTIAQLKENYGTKAVQIQYPVQCGAAFNAVVDVLKMKMYRTKVDIAILPEGYEVLYSFCSGSVQQENGENILSVVFKQ